MGCVRLVVEEADVDAVSGLLWRYGPLAVSEVPAGEGRVELLAGFGDATVAAAVADVLRDRGAATVAAPADPWWLDTWREHAVPVRVGGVLLWPAWIDGPHEAEGAVVVRLDAGRAFGSGSHASTRLALASLQEIDLAGLAVLDAGCGSGVLAVAAALLGAAPVVACDVDVEAMRATRRNAAANGVPIVLVDGGVERVRGPFDVIVANIGAGVLRAMAERLTALLAPGGRLVLSGLLVDQVPGVVAAFGGLRPAARHDEDGWSAVRLERSAGARA